MSIFLGKTIENDEGKQFYIYRTEYFQYTEGSPDYGHYEYKYINYYVDETGTFGIRVFILPMRGNVENLLSENTNYGFAKKQNCQLKWWLTHYSNTSPPRTGPKSQTLKRRSEWYERAYLYNYLNGTDHPDPFQRQKKRKFYNVEGANRKRKKINNNNNYNFRF